ncbi:hypothetical protein K435DRAFT_590757, partial [Dendrothele bispora CBS 962.96]
AAWLPYRDEYLHEMLWVEGRRGMGEKCSGCGDRAGVIYRCVEDECFGMGMMCDFCIVSAHRYLPLHWIEKWNEKYFEPTTLKALGLTVQLGHLPGEICLFEHPAHSDFTVIHSNGIHQVSVNFCGCNVTLDHRTQLLRSMWYPATPKDPQTA